MMISWILFYSPVILHFELHTVSVSRTLLSHDFFLVPTGSDISDFIHNLESQNIKVEMMKQSGYMAAAPHSAAINVTGSSKVSF